MMISQLRCFIVADVMVALNYLTTIVALGAFWVAWREVRRNNKPIVRLKDFKGSMAGEVRCLKVCIENRGITLQDVSLSLNFRGPGKSGNYNLPLQVIKHGNRLDSAFLRGTNAEFELSTADNRVVDFCLSLKLPASQDPAICVWNSGFFVREFCIYRRGDRLRKMWNKLTFKLSWRRKVGEGVEGKGVFKEIALPRFIDRPMCFDFFLDVAGRSSVR